MGLLDRWKNKPEVPGGFTPKSWGSLREALESVPDRTPLSECTPRDTVRVGGLVVETAVERGDAPVFSVRIVDGTGEMILGWLGRETIPGIEVGVFLAARGTVGHSRRGEPLMLDPQYSIRVSKV